MAVYRPGKRGTIRSTAEYGLKDACIKLFSAMKGLGTDEDAVIDVICSHTTEQRQQIKKKYKDVYRKDLIKELDSEVSFSFGKLVLALMMNSEEFVLDCIHKAISSPNGKSKGGKLFKRLSSFFKEGLGGNEALLIGLLCSRSNEDLEVIKKAYMKKYGENLEEKMVTDGNNMPHDVCSFIIDMIGGERPEDEEEVDFELLGEDIEELSTCKNEDVLHTLLQERSFLHLRKLFDELMNVSGKTVEGIIEDEIHGKVSAEMRDAYKAMVTLIKDGEAVYYAERVKMAIEGAGTDDDTLLKIFVLRAEVDLVDIMEEYEKKYKVPMEKEVGDDTSGDFKNILMRLMTKPPPLPEEKKGKKKGKVVNKEEWIKAKKEEKQKEEVKVEEEVVELKAIPEIEATPPSDEEDDKEVKAGEVGGEEVEKEEMNEEEQVEAEVEEIQAKEDEEEEADVGNVEVDGDTGDAEEEEEQVEPENEVETAAEEEVVEGEKGEEEEAQEALEVNEEVKEEDEDDNEAQKKEVIENESESEIDSDGKLLDKTVVVEAASSPVVSREL